MKKWLLFSFSILSFIPNLLAQHADGLYYLQKRYDDDPYDELTYFYCGANYLSNNVYMGRHDSSSLPYLSAYLGYQLHIGFYAKASVSYAPTGNTGHFDLLALEGGYDRTFGYHFLAGASYEYDDYQRNSPSITAATKGKANIYCLYRNATFEPQLSFTSTSGQTSDYAIAASLTHNFRFVNNTLNIFPTLTFYAGSDNFYTYYFVNRIQATEHIMLPAPAVIADAGNVKPLAAEVCLKTMYRVNEWLFTLKPTWAIPLSAEKINLPGETKTEVLKNSLYLELDICHRYERK